MVEQNQLYLCGECSNPDANEDMVSLKAGEHIALAMDLACVDLIEECHHDKRVEDHREVLCWNLLQLVLMAAIVNIKRHLAYNNILNQAPPRLQQHFQSLDATSPATTFSIRCHLDCNNILSQTPPRLQQHYQSSNATSPTTTFSMKRHLACNNISNQTPPRLQQHSQSSNATSPTTTFSIIKCHLSCNNIFNHQTPPRSQQHSQ